MGKVLFFVVMLSTMRLAGSLRVMSRPLLIHAGRSSTRPLRAVIACQRPMMDHRAFCSASPAAEKQEDDELQLFDAEISFPMKLMPYVAVIQLSCFAVYAETAYTLSGDSSQLAYAAAGFLFPAGLVALRQHY